MDGKIHIIGVGPDGLAGLTSRERELLAAADLVLGSESTLALLPQLAAQHCRIGADLQEAVRLVESQAGHKKLVIVATGDPLFYGVARYLCDKLGKDHFEVLPHVTSMQLAFARVKESWEEAFLTNLASQPLERVIDRIRVAETVGIFPSEKEGPAEIAKQLLQRGLDYFRAFVCENLGGPDERITQGELADLQEMEFDPLNVLILRRKPGRPDRQRLTAPHQRFGNDDDVFARSRPKSGLITTAEVRAIALARMDVRVGSIVWDIGAGTGSVAIEAAQLLDQAGMVFAIEQDAADYHLMLANLDTFGVRNLKPIHGSAPAVFGELPAPDAIFVGAVGREVGSLLADAFKALRPGGRLVINVGTLESLSTTFAVLQELAGTVQVLLMNLSRGVEQLERLRFEAMNPTFLLWVQKHQEKEPRTEQAQLAQ